MLNESSIMKLSGLASGFAGLMMAVAYVAGTVWYLIRFPEPDSKFVTTILTTSVVYLAGVVAFYLSYVERVRQAQLNHMREKLILELVRTLDPTLFENGKLRSDAMEILNRRKQK